MRVAPYRGYNRVEGNRRASRNGPVSHLPPEIPNVPIRNLCTAVRRTTTCVRSTYRLSSNVLATSISTPKPPSSKYRLANAATSKEESSPTWRCTTPSEREARCGVLACVTVRTNGAYARSSSVSGTCQRSRFRLGGLALAVGSVDAYRCLPHTARQPASAMCHALASGRPNPGRVSCIMPHASCALKIFWRLTSTPSSSAAMVSCSCARPVLCTCMCDCSDAMSQTRLMLRVTSLQQGSTPPNASNQELGGVQG